MKIFYSYDEFSKEFLKCLEKNLRIQEPMSFILNPQELSTTIMPELVLSKGAPIQVKKILEHNANEGVARLNDSTQSLYKSEEQKDYNRFQFLRNWVIEKLGGSNLEESLGLDILETLKKFRYVCFYAFSFYYLQYIHKNEKSACLINLMDPEDFFGFFMHEIWLINNAFCIFSSIIEGQKTELELKPIIEIYVNSIFSTISYSGCEILFPCRSKSHAIYIALVNIDNDLFVRVDNFGLGADKSKEKFPPKKVAKLDLSNEVHKKLLMTYLCKVATLTAESNSNQDNDLEEQLFNVVHNKNGECFQGITQNEPEWPEHEGQSINNCVIYGLDYGISLRANRYADINYLDVIELLKKVVQVIGIKEYDKLNNLMFYKNLELTKKDIELLIEKFLRNISNENINFNELKDSASNVKRSLESFPCKYLWYNHANKFLELLETDPQKKRIYEQEERERLFEEIDRFIKSINSETANVQFLRIEKKFPKVLLPRGTYIGKNTPLLNPNFVGRKELLEKIKIQLNQKIDSKKELILTALDGLGGVGKTQIALRYLYEHQSDYPQGIYWIRSETDAELFLSYQDLATEFGILTDNLKPKELIAKVKIGFENRRGWLLIYDNAQKYEEIEGYIPKQGGHVLVTSRHVDWPTQESICVDVFTQSEAEEYIKLITKRDEPEAIRALTRLLSYLPLALAQAGAYIKRNRISVAKYLELYKTEYRELLASELMPAGSEHESVMVTWNITMKVIAGESKDALNILRFCAYLNSENIPHSFLYRYFSDEMREVSKIKFLNELRLLSDYSMIENNGAQENVSIHRLVQMVTREQLNKEDQIEYLKKTFSVLEKEYPYGKGKVQLSDYLNKKFCIPHLEALLVLVEERIKDIQKGKEKELETLLEKEVSFSLLTYLGDAYGSLEDAKKETEKLECALLIAERYFGFNHPNVAKILIHLGNGYHSLGDANKAQKMLERALKINEGHYFLNHPEVAVALGNLGSVHGSLGNVRKEKELLERALMIKEEHYAPHDQELAVTLMNLGNACGVLGDMKKAKSLLERALVISQKCYGSEHPEVAKVLVNLGNVYGDLGDPQKKKELSECALAINKKYYGPNHIGVAKILANLGNAYGDLGELQKKKELSECALVISEKYYGLEHPEVAKILTNLANAYGNLGDPRKQRELLERALLINEKYYGADHPEVAKTHANLGDMYGRFGNLIEKKKLLKLALVISEKCYASDHPEILKMRVSLGGVYLELGNAKKAKELLERVLMIIERYDASFNPVVVATALTSLGTAYGILGDTMKAKELLERALTIKKKYYGADHLEVATTAFNLGNACRILNEFQNALLHISKAYEILLNNPNVGPQDPRIQWAENALRETKDKIQNVNNMANSSVNVSSQPLKQVLRRCKLKTETELPSLETALRRSASEGNTQDVELILSQGTDINAQDSAKNKRTALHWAVVGKHKSVIEVLLKEGARTDIFDAFIKTAEDYARESGVEEIKQLFVAVTQEKLNHRKA